VSSISPRPPIVLLRLLTFVIFSLDSFCLSSPPSLVFVGPSGPSGLYGGVGDSLSSLLTSAFSSSKRSLNYIETLFSATNTSPASLNLVPLYSVYGEDSFALYKSVPFSVAA